MKADPGVDAFGQYVQWHRPVHAYSRAWSGSCCLIHHPLQVTCSIMKIKCFKVLQEDDYQRITELHLKNNKKNKKIMF